MKAMILAAGVGSRLRPTTDDVPKALVDVGGAPMLEIVIRRLLKVGVKEMIVNVFHMPEKIEAFLKSRRSFGIRIELSRESELLDTGGGLKKAAPFFDDGLPFFLHNADVYSDIDLDLMYRTHLEKNVLATLSVSSRQSARCLLFDQDGMLCGWENAAENKREWAAPAGGYAPGTADMEARPLPAAPVSDYERMAFNGIHVIEPEIFQLMTETGVFSITRAYLRLAGLGRKIHAFPSDGYFYRGVDELSKLDDARKHAAEHGLAI